jgi:hypothetical protein
VTKNFLARNLYPVLTFSTAWPSRAVPACGKCSSEVRGRFSTDLDFTGLEEHDHEDIILAMMGAFEQEFHGIRFHIRDNGYYETVDGL